MKTNAKDRLALFLCALLCAGMAWVFWYLLEKDGFVVITVIALLGLLADNYRLRRQLRRTS